MSISLRNLIRVGRCGPLLALLFLTHPAFGSLGSLALRATPEIVRADGHSTTTITAEVREGGGGLVPDGTQVHFTTTAGQIDVGGHEVEIVGGVGHDFGPKGIYGHQLRALRYAADHFALPQPVLGISK